MSTLYSKNMAWLEPFMSAATGFVPVDKVMRVHGYRVPKGKTASVYGRKYTLGNRYVITILAEEWSRSSKGYVKDSYEIILDTFAHELAHTVYFEHTPEHYRLKCKILLSFSKILKKQGIIDHSIPYGSKR